MSEWKALQENSIKNAKDFVVFNFAYKMLSFCIICATDLPFDINA